MPFFFHFFFYIDELYNGIERVAISKRNVALHSVRNDTPLGFEPFHPALCVTPAQSPSIGSGS